MPHLETTILAPQDEILYQKWLQKSHIMDASEPDSHYDYRGLFKALHGSPVPTTSERHFSDQFKQHGHTTFSNESQYSSGPSDGGSWRDDTFIPSTPMESPIQLLVKSLVKHA